MGATAFSSGGVVLNEAGSAAAVAVTHRMDGSTLIVSVTGEFDLISRGALVASADICDDQRVSDVIVDAEGLDFLDSTGLHEILLLQDIAQRRGAPVRITRTQTRVRRVLEIAGLGHLLGD